MYRMFLLFLLLWRKRLSSSSMLSSTLLYSSSDIWASAPKLGLETFWKEVRDLDEDRDDCFEGPLKPTSNSAKDVPGANSESASKSSKLMVVFCFKGVKIVLVRGWRGGGLVSMFNDFSKEATVWLRLCNRSLACSRNSDLANSAAWLSHCASNSAACCSANWLTFTMVSDRSSWPKSSRRCIGLV